MKPVFRIRNNFVEMITEWPSTKIAKTRLIHQKQPQGPRGRGQFKFLKTVIETIKISVYLPKITAYDWANSLDTGQAQQNVVPDLGRNCLVYLKDIFDFKLIEKKMKIQSLYDTMLMVHWNGHRNGLC